MLRVRNLIIAVAFLFFTPSSILAADGLEVHYSGEPGPIFDVANAAPGEEYTTTISLKNNYPETRIIGFEVNPGISGDLKNVVTLSVRQNPDGPLKYEKLLKDIYTYGEIWLDPLSSGSTASYDFSLRMNEGAGNQFQGRTESFRLNLGFVSQSAPPSTDSDEDFISTLQNTGAQLLASVFPATVQTTSTTTTTTTAGEVAGANTQDSEVRGKTDEKNDSCFWWLWVLIGLAIVLSGYGLYLRKRNRELRFWYVWLVFGISAIIIHRILHSDLEATWFCDWFWLLVFLELIFSYFFYQYFVFGRELRKN